MAVSLSTVGTTSWRNGISQPSLSCATKVFAGLKPQSLSFSGMANPSSNVGLYNTVRKRIHSRTYKPTRVRMCLYGSPMIVDYNPPGSNYIVKVDIWNALSREGIIFIVEHINEHVSNHIVAGMIYLDTLDSSQMLYLYLNPPGADLGPTMSIYDTMQSMQTPTATLCIGCAYGMESFLLAAGEKGHRSSYPASRFALQAPAADAGGQVDIVCREAQELSRLRDYLYKQLALQTGQPLEKIYEDLRYPKYMGAEEAVEYGLIDNIVQFRDKTGMDSEDGLDIF